MSERRMLDGVISFNAINQLGMLKERYCAFGQRWAQQDGKRFLGCFNDFLVFN